MAINKILVGTDFSNEAMAALNTGMNVARHTEAELILLHACSIPQPGHPDVPDSVKGAAERFEQMMRDTLDENRAQLEQLRETHAGQGVEVSHMVIDAFPDVGVANAARELDADMVIIGTHGRTGLRRLLLGSVAERVVRLTETDVLVARKGKHDGAGGFNHILVPTDFSEAAEKALGRAIDLVAPGGVIELVNFWQLPATATGYWGPTASAGSVVEPLRTELAETAAAMGNNLLDRYRPRHEKLVFEAVEEAPVNGIHDKLESGAYDLVVMGSHGRRGLRRLLLGSVAEATVRHAPISVLVVHAGGEK